MTGRGGSVAQRPSAAAGRQFAEPATHRRYGGSATTDVRRYEWQPVQVPIPPTPGTPLLGQTVLVLGGSAEHRRLVVDELTAAGAVATELDPTADPADIDALRAAVQAALPPSGCLDGIVDLAVPGPFDLDRHERWRSALLQTTVALQAVYDDWAAETDATRCFYVAVTWLGGQLGYDRTGVAQPLGGLWAGLAKSLPHELPACRVKVVDLAVPEADALGRLVVAEASSFDYYEVGYQGGRRYTLAGHAAPCPPARLELGPEDIVLVSGGGRGVGFAFARKIATDVGCRVVVTGRAAVPKGTDWAELDEAAYQEQCRERLREAGPARVGEVRRENKRRDALRGVAANLAAAAADGLRIEYRACDFLDASAVSDLVSSLGADLRVVIHNAGIAAPTRLRGKAPETVLAVVESKLVTFTNLVQAVRDCDLAYFCNVGSVAGRMGGMVGQIDYAAANDVLSRLGFWAQEQLGLPVATVCWTTWEQIGLIANYEAALRYGAALKVEEGVQHWLDELLAAQPTESMYLGRIGTALAPTQIKGFEKFAGHPDLPWLLSRLHYLGDVEQFAPFRSVRSRSVLEPGRHPALNDVTLDGHAAMPVAVALEYAISVGDWIAPEGWPLLHLRELRDIAIDLTALRLDGSPHVLVKEGAGARENGDWVVRTTLRSADGREVLRARLVYREEPTAPVSVRTDHPLIKIPAPSQGSLDAGGERPSRLQWHGLVYPRLELGRGSTQVVAALRPTHDSDAWTAPYPPQSALPAAAVEAVLQGVTHAGASPVGTLTVDRLELTPTGAPEAQLVGSTDGGTWQVLDRAGEVVMRWTGVVLS